MDNDNMNILIKSGEPFRLSIRVVSGPEETIAEQLKDMEGSLVTWNRAIAQIEDISTYQGFFKKAGVREHLIWMREDSFPIFIHELSHSIFFFMKDLWIKEGGVGSYNEFFAYMMGHMTKEYVQSLQQRRDILLHNTSV
jgi:hypothetical protein